MTRTALTLAVALLASGIAHADPFEDWLKAQQDAGQLAAAAVARIEDGKTTTRGYGHRDGGNGPAPDGASAFQLGSITKVFTHLLLAEMVADGQVKYDTPIGALLPDALAPANRALPGITLEALATHRSGLPRLPPNLDHSKMEDPYAAYGTEQLHAGLKVARNLQPLGSYYAYSNFGVGLLGHLLGQKDGRGYRAALQARVIEPLGLRHTGEAPGENAVVAISAGKPVPAWRFQDALAGAGALWGSVEDLARLVDVWLSASETGLKHAVAGDLEIVARAGGFELTRVWHVARAGGVPVYWHNGGTQGFHSFVGFRPDTRQGIAILVSGGADPTDFGLAALGVDEAEPKAPDAPPPDAALLGQYALTPQFGIGVFEREGILLAQASGQPPIPLHRVDADWYAFDVVDASLHFLREDGRVVGLELAQNGHLQSAPRTAEVATVIAEAAKRNEIELGAEQRAAYVGTYAFAPEAVLTVRNGENTIEAQLTGQPFFPVFARGGDRFFYKVVEAELQFERDAGGKVTAVVLHQAGIEQRAPRRED